jgi:serine O-acetyltransferase
MTLRDVLLADLAVNWRHRGRPDTPSGWGDIFVGLADVRFLPIALIRLAATLGARGKAGRIGERALSLANRVLFGVECARQTRIGPGLYFPHTGGIVIGAAEIGADCTIYHQVTLGAKFIDMQFTAGQRPVVEDGVVIAAGAKVLGGVRVGASSVVAANAVVVDDVPPNAVVGGVPARLLKTRDT